MRGHTGSGQEVRRKKREESKEKKTRTEKEKRI